MLRFFALAQQSEFFGIAPMARGDLPL